MRLQKNQQFLAFARAQRNTCSKKHKQATQKQNADEWIAFRITRGVQIYKNKNKNLEIQS